ncbi:hypothetical protein RFI_27508 [Reticulomyxa filosa]|uniref:V-type proton ATPase subunit C n=1 Tax=Reticulomyxa filosa TaxID=46433 RepID=X6M7J0_RETFI|nr:hypothetical protein RFI_27508 [Reticulomyxa filosa]|eukprot:ETO09869.1 hypothetical protein RFI_27508 [Reticulomyxa filosa]
MSSQQSLEYWLISVPNEGNQEKALKELNQSVGRLNGQQWYLQNVPLTSLRVGKIDDLLALSESMGKIDAFGKSLVQKLHRTYAELEKTDQLLSVYTKPIHGYLTTFEWDDGHINPRLKLQDLVQVIHINLQKTAEKLRTGSAKLGEIQGSLNAIERKKTAALLNKNLREYVDDKKWLNGEYLCSALVIVPVNKRAEFLKNYEFMEDGEANEKLMKLQKERKEQALKHEQEKKEKEQKEEKALEEKKDDHSHPHGGGGGQQQQHHDEHAAAAAAGHGTHGHHQHQEVFDMIKTDGTRTVIPNSARELSADNESALFQVDLLKKGHDWFRAVCREQGFIVREFSLDLNEEKDEERALMELKKQQEEQTKKLKVYCSNNFSETFARYVHLKIIRIFVESVLRFGLPVDFAISLVQPPKGKEKKLLEHLKARYAHLVDVVLQGPKPDNEVDFSSMSGDFYPFVFVPINIELS